MFSYHQGDPSVTIQTLLFLFCFQVDGESLRGFNNHQAVSVLRNTGSTVWLQLARYNHGPKYRQLQLYAGKSA